MLNFMLVIPIIIVHSIIVTNKSQGMFCRCDKNKGLFTVFMVHICKLALSILLKHSLIVTVNRFISSFN